MKQPTNKPSSTVASNPRRADEREGSQGTIFFGWYIVAATVLLNCFYGGVLFYGFPVFLDYIIDDFQWRRSLAAFAFGIVALEGGMLAPFYGGIVGRFGTRIPIFAGSLIGALGFVVLSQTNSLSMFYFGFFLAGFGLGVWYVAPLAAITNWFKLKRGRALGIAAAGFGLSGILAPFLVFIIEHYGWRTTLLMVAGAVCIIGTLASLVIRNKPEDHGCIADGIAALGNTIGQNPITRLNKVSAVSAREAVKTGDFWLLSMIYTGAFLATTALIPHLLLYLGDVGIEKKAAVFAITTMTTSGILGRLGGGFLGDIFDKRYIVAAAITLLGLATLAFAFVSQSWLFVIMLLIGPSFGALTPLIPALIADTFGTRSFALIMGLCMVPSTAICFGAPAAAGWVADSFGSYRPAWIAVAVITLAIAPVSLRLQRPNFVEPGVG